MADYAIDRFDFLLLREPPEYPASQVELEAHAGSDGHSLWDLGQRGMPFEVQSLAPTESAAHAAALLRLYRQLIARGLVDMKWGGHDVVGVQYAVLAVRPDVCAGVLFGKVAAITAPAFGVCRCTWTLLPMVA